MPNIPYPNVPAVPGVPPLNRDGAASPIISLALGALQTVLANALQNGTQWGIFDAEGNQLGLVQQTDGAFQSIITAIGNGPILSTNAVEFLKETRISDFPIERGSFASYNKVQLPASPMVTLALSGSVSDRTAFLNQIEAACIGTDLYSVATPEVTYLNYSLERYTFVRRAERGATLLLVEITLKEIRQVSAAFSTVQTPITQPQDPNAVPQSNSGLVQPQAPPQSTAKALYNLFPSLKSIYNLFPSSGGN